MKTIAIHGIATNLECKAEDVVWQYNSIADAENMIMELKIGFDMEEMPRGLCETHFGLVLGYCVTTHLLGRSCIYFQSASRKSFYFTYTSESRASPIGGWTLEGVERKPTQQD